MATFNFEAPQNVVQVLAHFFNNHRVNMFFTDLDRLLCMFVTDLISGIMSEVDDAYVSQYLSILHDVLKDDACLTNLVKNKASNFLEALGMRICGPQEGDNYFQSSVTAIWIVRQIYPEALPRIGMKSKNISPTLLEQIVLAYAEYLAEVRDTEAVEGLDLALWALQLHIPGKDDSTKVKYAALQLLNRCIVDYKWPCRHAVDHLLGKNFVPLLIRSSLATWTSLKGENRRWEMESIIGETTKLAIGIASVKTGRDQLLEFHDTLRQWLFGLSDDCNRRWLMYCVATISGPHAILEYIHMIETSSDVDKYVPSMLAALQVLSQFISDRIDDDSPDGCVQYLATTKMLTSMAHQANCHPNSDRMMAILPDLIRAIRESVSKLSSYPQSTESREVLRETLSVVFLVLKAKSKNDEVVQISVEVLGIVLDCVQVSTDVRPAIMEQLREVHRHHLSSRHTQHWILWTVLLVTDLSTMLSFMKEHIDAPAVQEGAISSLCDYSPERTVDGAEDIKPIAEAVHFVSHAIQRFPHLREKGVYALGALSCLYPVDEPPHQASSNVCSDSLAGMKAIVEFISKILTCDDRDAWSAREECIKSLRQVLERIPRCGILLGHDAVDAIVTHLEANFAANDHQELFIDGLWLVGYSKGTGEICKFLETHWKRPGVFRCGFHSLRDLYTQQPALLQHPSNAMVCQMVQYALERWSYVPDTVEAAHLMAGILMQSAT